MYNLDDVVLEKAELKDGELVLLFHTKATGESYARFPVYILGPVDAGEYKLL